LKTSYIEYPCGRREYVAMGKDGLFYSYFDEACKKGYLKLHHPKFEIAVSEGFATLYPANEADCEAMYAALQTYAPALEKQIDEYIGIPTRRAWMQKGLEKLYTELRRLQPSDVNTSLSFSLN